MERYSREVTRRLRVPCRVVQPARPAQGLAGHLWEQAVLPRLTGDHLLWSPANTGPIAVSRQVVTLHDLIVLDHPEWYRADFAAWYRFLLPRLARRAERVLTDSQYSHSRLVARLGLSAEKIAVIPPGVDRDRFHPLSETERARFRERCRLPGRYLLFIGAHDPRKNLERLLSAWELVRRSFADVELVVVGTRRSPFARAGRASSLVHAEQLRWLDTVSEDNLPCLYASALGLLVPSLAEGFGLPALEAMACGIPVAAANAGALPEVGGEAALYVNPYQVGEMAAVIDRLLSEPELRRDLAQKGLERAASFTWERTARAVEQVLEALL